ncbi:MAG: hypothetical protein DSY76_04180 [Bacteroidetes bacterium]|nr:MAG: hypothetical protein DSY76_04180 [Bacteroidota bacterium]
MLLAEALRKLYPNANFGIKNDEIVYWQDENPQPKIEDLQGTIEELELQKAIEDKKEKIISEYKRKMAELTKDYTEEEQKTWNTQVIEAQNYLKATQKNKKKLSLYPMLVAIADGGDIGVLAQKIVRKSNFLKIESGKLLAWKNRELAEIG